MKSRQKSNELPKKFGKWTVIKRIGSGGNGNVYSAIDESQRQVAIKLLSRRDGDRRQRFLDEIKALRTIGQHPGVLPLIDFSEKELWYVIPLAQPVQKALGNHSSLETVVSAIRDFAVTLADLVDKYGISHRDIKPDNLFKYDGRWVIGDFGLVDFPGKAPVTTSGRHLGPVFYIAPEMLNNPRESDGSPADVYSLGKTLWVLATGQKYPLPGELPATNNIAKLSSQIMHPRAFLLDLLIEKTSKTNPRDRLTMRELADELEAWLKMPDNIEDDIDLTEFGSTIREINEPGLLKLREDDDARRKFRELVRSIEDKLQPLTLAAQKAGIQGAAIQQGGDAHDLYSLLGEYDATRGYCREQIPIGSVVPLYEYSNMRGLVSGTSLRLAQDFTLEIASGHLIVWANPARAKVLFATNKQEVHFGSIEQEKILTEQIQSLVMSYRDAFSQFAAHLKK